MEGKVSPNIEVFSKESESRDAYPAEDVFSILMKYSRTLPEDFDYTAELEAAREEKCALRIF